MALEQEIKVYQFAQGYGEMLLNGITEDKAFELICDGGVHPAWIIGHLGYVANGMLARCGAEPKIDLDALKGTFGGGSKPAADDKQRYPSWENLVKTWKQGHADLAELIPTLTKKILDLPNPSDRMRDNGLPTMKDLLSFVLTAHEGMHLGQLSTWRRVQGHPPLF